MIGLGCMRLSTREPREHARSIAVIHAALDAGASLLDTAAVYCLHEREIGHNERLVAEALRSWNGDRSTIEVATKGGLTRRGTDWVPDGRAKHLRAACDASRQALGVDSIDLYQLHVVDPKTSIETSVRALASLQHDGAIRRIGLCNVTVGQIEAARRIAEIASVQISLSIFDDDNFRNGVAEYCRDHGIRLIAYRPLGGGRAGALGQDALLNHIAAYHDASPHEMALAWLMDLDPLVVPIPGATHEATAHSLGRVLRIALTDDDRVRLDERFPAGRLLRVPRALRRPEESAEGDIVLVMGMPAAGKSEVATELAAQGYERLNRDSRGGRLSDLVTALDAGLAGGERRFVLDNTYPSRRARNEVIECAWQHGVNVRCVWLTTSLADAQINAVSRLVETRGRLPMPEELRAKGPDDHRFFGPDAQFRYERQLEPPVPDEGFTSIEQRVFVRRADSSATERAVLLEYDDVLAESASGATTVLDAEDIVVSDSRRETLKKYAAQGWRLLAIAWRPQIAKRETTQEAVLECFARTRELLGLDIDIAYCPHDAGPPICWCRKPLPGLALELAFRHRVALERSILVGRSPADRTMAERLGMTHHGRDELFRAG
jgi:aryl-alcohol dehydrogenase-like predicted oxidoreductase/histidinol phosphatase-like enzyme